MGIVRAFQFMKGHEGLEKKTLEGIMDGKLVRGRQGRRWESGHHREAEHQHHPHWAHRAGLKALREADRDATCRKGNDT